MKALQTFTDEYLERCKSLSIEEKLDFIENFRLMHSELHSPSKLNSIKTPEALEVSDPNSDIENWIWVN